MNAPETFFSVKEELSLFFMSCAAGAVIGVLWDILRTFRMVVPHSRFFIMAEDFLFFTFYAIFLVSFASAEARGTLRAYYAVGNILGFTLYHFTVGAAVMSMIRTILTILRKLLRTILSPIRACLHKVYVLLYEKGRCKFVGCYKNAVNRLKKVKIPLQKRRQVLYNKRVSKQAGIRCPGSAADKRKVNRFAGKEKKSRKARKAK